MKRWQFVFLVLVLLGVSLSPAHPTRLPPASPFACTSFAVYADQPLYGMNFDYPEVEVRFTITTSGDKKIFQMEFLQDGDFVPTVGMNSEGLFASCQMLFPEADPNRSAGANELYTWQLYSESLDRFDTVAEVETYLQDRRLIHWGVTLHDLIADVEGAALVAEAGEQENLITRMEGDFLVMTNFPIAQFAGASYRDVEGAGAERYIAAYENIQKTVDGFHLESALETLELALSSGDWPTQASMVFDPVEGEVFIALKGDFSRIWKASMEEGIIETHAGFGEALQMPMNSSGVLASDLADGKAAHSMPWWIVVTVAAVLAGGGWLTLTGLRRRRVRSMQEGIPLALEDGEEL